MMNEETFNAEKNGPWEGFSKQGKTRGIPFNSEDELDPDQYLRKAKRILRRHFFYARNDKPDDIYIVWFAKTLENWKALLSTSFPDGEYYEITYDGTRKQSYLDVYVKVSNLVCTDDMLDRVYGEFDA